MQTLCKADWEVELGVIIGKPGRCLCIYVSQVMTLQSGDLIPTGTPRGVGLGQYPHQYLSAGRIIHLGITGLGVGQQRTVPALLRCRA